MPFAGTQPGPAWYDENYLYRWPIAVDAVTGNDSGSVDINVTIPPTWDWFWDNVQDDTNGYDIIVCGSDGVTLTTFQYSGFNYANRSLTIQIDAYALDGTGKMNMIWLYWNYDGAPDETGSFTPSGPITGYIERGIPTLYNVQARPMILGNESPSQVIQIPANDVVSVAIDITGILPLQSKKYNGKFNYIGPLHVTSEVAAGGSGASTDDESTRYTYYNDKLYALSKFTGHSADGTDTGIFTVKLSDDQDLEFRFGILTESQVYS